MSMTTGRELSRHGRSSGTTVRNLDLQTKGIMEDDGRRVQTQGSVCMTRSRARMSLPGPASAHSAPRCGLTRLDLGLGPPGIAIPIHGQHVIRKRLSKDQFRGGQWGLGGRAILNLDEGCLKDERRRSEGSVRSGMGMGYGVWRARETYVEVGKTDDFPRHRVLPDRACQGGFRPDGVDGSLDGSDRG